MVPKNSWYKVLSPNEANTELLQLSPQLGRGSLQMKCSLLFVQTENWKMSALFSDENSLSASFPESHW